MVAILVCTVDKALCKRETPRVSIMHYIIRSPKDKVAAKEVFVRDSERGLLCCCCYSLAVAGWSCLSMPTRSKAC